MKIAIALVLALCAELLRSRSSAKNKIAYDQFDWKMYKSTHFIDLLLR